MSENTGVLYGDTGLYKTWSLGLLSKYIFSRTKKPVGLVTADGGGFRPIKSFIEAGIIKPLVIIDDPMRMALMRKIAGEGQWPQDIDLDGNRLSKTMLTEGVKEFGGIFFEGMTSIAESLHRLYAGRKVGMNPAYTENVLSDLVNEKGIALKGEVVGSYSQDSYNIIQQEMIKLINSSWSLSCPYVWWTGHEAASEDELSRTQIRGVGLVGKAATPRIGRNVGSMIHAYTVETVKVIGAKSEKAWEVRYYFQPHPDRLIPNAFWSAKSRIPGDQMEKLLEKFPGGYFVPEYSKGLDEYIRVEEELIAGGSAELKNWVSEVLKEGK